MSQPTEQIAVVGDILPNDHVEIGIFNDKGSYYLSILELTSPFLTKFRVPNKGLPEQIKVDSAFVHFVSLPTYNHTLVLKRMESVPTSLVNPGIPFYDYIDAIYRKIAPAQTQPQPLTPAPSTMTQVD